MEKCGKLSFNPISLRKAKTHFIQKSQKCHRVLEVLSAIELINPLMPFYLENVRILRPVNA